MLLAKLLVQQTFNYFDYQIESIKMATAKQKQETFLRQKCFIYASCGVTFFCRWLCLMYRPSWMSCAEKFAIWHASNKLFLGDTFTAKRMKMPEYTHNAKVILPLINFGSFCVSARAAIGMVQLKSGPQKCVLVIYSLVSFLFNWLTILLIDKFIFLCSFL